jgi:hypothetical protein
VKVADFKDAWYSEVLAFTHMGLHPGRIVADERHLQYQYGMPVPEAVIDGNRIIEVKRLPCIDLYQMKCPQEKLSNVDCNEQGRRIVKNIRGKPVWPLHA